VRIKIRILEQDEAEQSTHAVFVDEDGAKVTILSTVPSPPPSLGDVIAGC
jgi:hypothetical protein